MLEERKVAREQRSQLNSTRQRVAWLGQREQRAVQGAARARRAASFSLSILLTQARALDSALATMQATPPPPAFPNEPAPPHLLFPVTLYVVTFPWLLHGTLTGQWATEGHCPFFPFNAWGDVAL